MKRKIIKINERLCNGCGACATACHEGAIEMIDGKARLTKENYCDGLGDCLPACPTGAISFEFREAPEYDASAVLAARAKMNTQKVESVAPKGADTYPKAASRLMQWPCQIKLVSPLAPLFDGANLLIAADCTAYAYADFHNSFMKDRITLIGCQKLDGVDYSERLASIIKNNNIRSIKILRMEVPCCGGLESAVKRAIAASGKDIPFRVVIVSTDGKITD